MKRTALAIVILAALAVAQGYATADATTSSSILVLDHAFAKGYRYTGNGHIILLNRTSTFTQDDQRVYSYVKATFYSANLTWNWYNPSGLLYSSNYYSANCVASPCDELSSMRISGAQAAKEIGQWRVDFLADGTRIFSDSFWLTAVITQYNYWNFTIVNSARNQINGSLRVIIQPPNQTWSYYRIYMPYASNITAYDYTTLQQLPVTINKDTSVVVNLEGPRASGYSFVLKFGVSYVLQPLGGGNYVMTWREFPWERYNDIHPIPEQYVVNLPNSSSLMDVVGFNSMDLKYSPLAIPENSFSMSTNFTAQNYGWNILYRDSATQSHPTPLSTGQPTLSSSPRLPLLPLTMEGVSTWAAVMSVFLLTASELASPIYTRSGYGILINRKRLRLAALVLVAIFIITVASQLLLQHAIIQR